MGSGNDGRTLTQTEAIWRSVSRNLECSDMGEITITDRPAHPRRAARRLSPTPVVEQGRRRFDAEAQRKNAPKNGAAQRAPGLEGYSTDYPTMTTVTWPGPCTPRTRMCAISAVRLGPVISTMELVCAAGSGSRVNSSSKPVRMRGVHGPG